MSRFTWFVTAALMGTSVAFGHPAIAAKSAAKLTSIAQTPNVKIQLDRRWGNALTLQDEPTDAEAYYTRGNLKARKLNDIPGALADYNRAITLNPQLTQAYSNRGLLKDEKLNDTQGALSDYNRAITLNPEFAELYLNRGLLKARKLSDKAGAIQDFRQAAKLFRAQGQTQYLQKALDNLRKLDATEQASNS